jgi:predicted transcriptional regulator
MPVGMVVAEFDVKEIHAMSPSDLWDATKDYAGISHDRFMEYFSGRDIGYAIEIGTVNQFDKPLSLANDFGVTPPQSFVYVEG